MDTNHEIGNPRKTRGPVQTRRDRVGAFRKLFEINSNVLVLINPDPDSMASALVVKRLLWKFVHRTVIGYIGEINRLDNLAMVELLKIPMVKLKEVDPEGFTHFILVDSQPNHSEIFGSFKYDAIIDHHAKTRGWDAPYVDIRPEYGANSTILTEYLRGAGIKPSQKIATALLYAIKTDTSNFERSGMGEDIRQFQYLFDYANMNLLRKIEKSELRLGDLDYFQKGLANRVVAHKGIYTHLGKVSSPDICVQIADFFTRVHRIGWIFVSGVYGDTLVIIIRIDGYRKNAGTLASQAFGDVGSAGGHPGAARAEIPLKSRHEKGVKIDGTSLKNFIRGRLKF
jgi:nanoRNase/pAp phosphatase (c-di-AMP/oligoRNAs hydrolase)